ncbi:MAG: hypothetical protein Q4D60_02995 [Eubacteriales bacterium]|nr:hypothetical protein [Eubacteriales bacterium]
MKKNCFLKKCFVLVLAAMACLLASPVSAHAAKGKYKAIYNELLEQSTLRGTKPTYFALVDVDQNGVPELFVNNYDFAPNAAVAADVYTVKKRKAVYCGIYGDKGADGCLHYSKKHKALYENYWINGLVGTGKRLYRFSNCKLKEYKHLYFQTNAFTTAVKEYKYASKGAKLKNISAAKYKSLNKKYFKKFKKYSFKENTAANRQAYLK